MDFRDGTFRVVFLAIDAIATEQQRRHRFRFHFALVERSDCLGSFE